MIKIFVEAKDIADYHQQIAGEEPPDLHLVAKNDNAESCVYISDNNWIPVITVTLHGIEVETISGFEDSDELIDTAKDVYERYIMVVDDGDIDMRKEDEDEDEEEYDAEYDDEQYSDDDLRAMYGKDEEWDDAEDFEYEYGATLEDAFLLLVDTRELMEFSDSYPEEYDNMIESVKDYICDTLEYYGLEVKRPAKV